MYIEQEDILKHISAKPFHLISEAADELGVEAYVIGGISFCIALPKISMSLPSGAESSWRKLLPGNWDGELICPFSRTSVRHR